MGAIPSKESYLLERVFRPIEASTSRFSIATMRTSKLLDGTNQSFETVYSSFVLVLVIGL